MEFDELKQVVIGDDIEKAEELLDHWVDVFQSPSCRELDVSDVFQEMARIYTATDNHDLHQMVAEVFRSMTAHPDFPESDIGMMSRPIMESDEDLLDAFIDMLSYNVTDESEALLQDLIDKGASRIVAKAKGALSHREGVKLRLR